jgi:hypothetical protein
MKAPWDGYRAWFGGRNRGPKAQLASLRAGLCCLGLLACGARTELDQLSVNGGAPSASGAPSFAGAPSFGGAPSFAGAPNAGAPSFGGAAGAPPLLVDCPSGPDDPRLPQLQLGVPTPLDGTRFVSGAVKSWHWDLVREDCDAIVVNPEFVLEGADSSQLLFQAVRPSPYHFTLTVMSVSGEVATCNFNVATQSRGMRIEVCWNTSQNTDLDLYLHNPFDTAPWFTPTADTVADGINGTTCNVANCTANLRLSLPRADFGYADSPPAYCQAGPAAAEFQALGRCPNPRDGEDDNQSLATGVAERIQLDSPTNGQTFRVMVQNFSNTSAQPHVFAYCGGQKAGEAQPPPAPVGFVAPSPGVFGVMWRAADVTTRVANASTIGCTFSLPSAPGGGVPYVTIDDPTF